MAFFGFGYKKRFEELKTYMEEERYEDAALVADRIPEQKVKSAHELNLIGKAYKCNGDFLQAKEIFERSYLMRCSRTVLLDVLDCCLEIKDLEAAERYFDEYHKVAPEDKVTQYVYRYRIEKKKGRDRRLLITILEELKALEYIEEYAYELAKQYHKAGMVQECMNECHEIMLWFGFGPTVERAKTLLAYYRGEISLEEIKSAGVRYREEQVRIREEVIREEAAVTEETSVSAETMQEPKVYMPETEEKAEAEEYMPEAAEEAEPEEYTSEAVEEAEAEEYMPEAAEEAMPEVYLPEIEEELVPEEDIAEPAENMVSEQVAMQECTEEVQQAEEVAAVSEEWETQNERLAEMLRKSRVSVSDVLKNFGRIERIRKQVVKSLELVVNDREKAYFVITGEPQTGKTTLAFHMIHLLYELGIVKYDRTATIDAVQLNQVSILDYGEELRNCNLIIENAGGMTRESIDGLIEFSRGRKGSICVILEDSVRDINKFLRGREELNRLFNNRIHLGKYNAEDLMGFAYDYIKKEDYSIDKMATQVLRNNIDEIVRNYGNEQRLFKTLELVKQTIDRAEKRTGTLLLSMATEGRIQSGNYLVITAEDMMQ